MKPNMNYAQILPSPTRNQDKLKLTHHNLVINRHSVHVRKVYKASDILSQEPPAEGEQITNIESKNLPHPKEKTGP